MEEKRTTGAILNVLTQVPHRDYDQIVPALREALDRNPYVMARGLTWVALTSKIRDQVEAAVVALLLSDPDYNLREVGRCLLIGSRIYDIDHPDQVPGLEPYRIFRVEDYIYNQRPNSPRLMKSIMRDYLGAMFANPDWFDRVEILPGNREAMIRCVHRYSIKMPNRVKAILFDDNPPEDSPRFHIKDAASYAEQGYYREAAEVLVKHNLPMEIVASLIPKSEPVATLALIEVMTPQQALNSIAWVERSGYMENPEFAKVFSAKVKQAKGYASATGRRSAQAKSEVLKEAVEEVKERSLELQKIDKKIVCFVDVSASMNTAVDIVKELAKVIGPLCETLPRWIFFNNRAWEAQPEDFNMIRADGGTVPAEAYRLMKRLGYQPDSIVIISDGEEWQHRAPRLCKVIEPEDSGREIVMIRVPAGTDYMSSELERVCTNFTKYEWRGDYYLLDQIAVFLATNTSLEQQILEVQLPRRYGV